MRVNRNTLAGFCDNHRVVDFVKSSAAIGVHCLHPRSCMSVIQPVLDNQLWLNVGANDVEAVNCPVAIISDQYQSHVSNPPDAALLRILGLAPSVYSLLPTLVDVLRYNPGRSGILGD